MKDLKFRAWDKVQQSYIYSDKIAGGLWRFFKLLEDRGIRHFEIQQFTGYRDKTGKLIYDGDIVRVDKEEIGTEKNQVCSIEYDGGCCYQIEGSNAGCYSLADISEPSLRVIGNFNETPNLSEV